jgi:hypothetical protein
MATPPEQPISGRYRGRRGDFEAELRIDVDGARPTHRVSADYFEIRGDTHVYSGSMIVDAPTVRGSRAGLMITGRGRASWDTRTNDVRVTIARGRAGSPATARLLHLSARGEVRGQFDCRYESAAFRKAYIEEAVEHGVTRFASYDTGALPAGSPPRTLTHLTAFGEAGIEMVRTRGDVSIAADANDSWSDAELQAAMAQHFSLYADAEEWAIWLLHARLHDRDKLDPGHPRVIGLMFDRWGRQRQGCALFYAAMSGTLPEFQRIQLFTGVHELGHGFNLLHCFQKSLAIPPVPSRPKAASWMAYPERYPAGADAFWRAFAFQFDDPELVHLRHAMRDDVIMGGNPLAAGAAFELDAGAEAGTGYDSGLRLALEAPARLPYGFPVTVDFELSGTTSEGRQAPSVLGPRAASVDVLIRRPDGTTVVFEPFLRHCRLDDAALLRAGDPPRTGSAFIHYGKHGHPFDRPGRYHCTARCSLPDGVSVVSDVVHVEIAAPVTRDDHAAAELAFGDDQGALMSLVGSDSPQLQAGNDALRTLVERYPHHPVAAVPKLVLSTNAARVFKSVQPDGSVRRRPSQPQEAAMLMGSMPGLETSLRSAGLGEDRVPRPEVSAELLRRLAGPAATGTLHPYIRSRFNEIEEAAYQVLASGRREPVRSPARWRPIRPR